MNAKRLTCPGCSAKAQSICGFGAAIIVEPCGCDLSYTPPRRADGTFTTPWPRIRLFSWLPG